MLITVGAIGYRVWADCRSGRWVAAAVRDGSGQRFGPETTGETEGEATSRLVRWLTWQHEHGTALRALQEAERAYHRAVASAFDAEPRAAMELQKTTLRTVQDARARLDVVRARRPE